MISTRPYQPTLAELLPAPDFAERHQRRIQAQPPAVWAALHEVRLSDLALSRTLMDIRTLPLRLLGRERPQMVTGRFLETGPVPVLASDPERAVVAAGAIQPWKLRGAQPPPTLDPDGLREFDQPGWVKVGIDFVLEQAAGHTLLRTETRVVATDAATRRRFAVYWMAIRLGSGLIRRDVLRAVADRAERGDRN